MADINALFMAAISEDSFVSSSGMQSSHYVPFIAFLAERLSSKIEQLTVRELHATVTAEGPGHAGVRGRLTGESFEKTFYIDAAWLPKLTRFRGKLRLNDVPAPPKPKTIEQFIDFLNVIADENTITYEGQIFEATQGVHAADTDFSKSYPAIFDLFERHPEEFFGMPGELVHMMEEHGQYESELLNSLLRKPSASTLLMANRIMNSLVSESSEHQKWLSHVKVVADSQYNSELLREEAQDIVDYQSGR